jgi:DNA-binding transcriptional LysR family regulator
MSEAPWILPPAPDGPVRRALDARFVAAGLPTPRPAFATPHLSASLRMVAAGLGLSAVPEIVASEAEASGQVRRIAVKPELEMPPTCLLYRRALADHPRIRAIVAAVRTAVDEMISRDKNLRRA